MSEDIKQKVLDAIARGKAVHAEELRKKREVIDAKIRAEREHDEHRMNVARSFVAGNLVKLIEQAAERGEDRILVDDDQHGKIPYIARACREAGITVVADYQPPQLAWDNADVKDFNKYYIML